MNWGQLRFASIGFISLSEVHLCRSKRAMLRTAYSDENQLIFFQLLPPTNSKSAHNVADVCLRSKDTDPEMSARVSITTRWTLTLWLLIFDLFMTNVIREVRAFSSVTLNRELQLIAGEFMEHQVQSDSHLSYLCQCAALNRGGLTPTTTVHIATHRWGFSSFWGDDYFLSFWTFGALYVVGAVRISSAID